MPTGVLGIPALTPTVSTKPDTIPAIAARSFPHPIHNAIAIVLQLANPVLDANNNFVRYPVKVNSQMTMGLWNADGTFTASTGATASRVFNENDVLNPTMMAKYPDLATLVPRLVQIIELEAVAQGII